MTMTSKTDKRKQSVYIPEPMLAEIKRECERQDRSLSWLIQRAWKIARGEIMKTPSVKD
jgi:uncharacterized small protein (TIGR04563 family)